LSLSKRYIWRLKVVLAPREALRDTVADVSESGTVYSAPCAALLAHVTGQTVQPRTRTHTSVSTGERASRRGKEQEEGGGGRRRRAYGGPELTTERCH